MLPNHNVSLVVPPIQDLAPRVIGLTASPGGDVTLEGTVGLVAALAAALGAEVMALDDGSGLGGSQQGSPSAGSGGAEKSCGSGGTIGGVKDAAAGGEPAGGRGGNEERGKRGAGGGNERAPSGPPAATDCSGGAPRQARVERAFTLPMREVDGAVWRSLLLGLTAAIGRVGAAIRGEAT